MFPVVTSGDETLKYVFPSKQRAAQQAVALARQDDRIRRLVVFGSAVSMLCGTVSDLDIAVEAPNIPEEEFLKIARNFYRGIASEVNMIHYNAIQSPLLKKEIDEKGVNVYSQRIASPKSPLSL